MGSFSSAHSRQGVLQLPRTSGAGKTRVKGQGTEAGAYLARKNRDRPPLAGQVEDRQFGDVTACSAVLIPPTGGQRGVSSPEAVVVHVREVLLTRKKWTVEVVCVCERMSLCVYYTHTSI